MADKFFLIVVKDIIINPVTAWETIDSEARPVKVGIFVAGDLLFSKVIDRIYSIFFS